MIGTKEHYELLKNFEQIMGKRFRFDKEDKDFWKKGVVYQDGMVNEMYRVFIKGYALGKFECRD